MKSESLTSSITSLFLNLGNRLTAPFGKTTHFQRSFRIERPVQEVYAFWRDFHNFKKATRAADRIEVRNPHESWWSVRGPFGLRLQWHSEITVEDAEHRVGWRTIAPSDVPHVGQVVFHALDEGKATEVALAVDYRVPLGPIGEALTWVLRSGPEVFISEEIARVKLAIEGHRSRAAEVAKAHNLIDVAAGPPNPPVKVAPRKPTRAANRLKLDAKAQLFDNRARLRTQH